MQLANLLKGYKTGKMQKAGIMTMVPIITENVWEKIGEFDSIYIKRDPDYGRLIMGNDQKEVTIIPHGLAYITEEYCQDRTIPQTHLMKYEKECNAKCIQSSQCGHFEQNKKEREARFMPRTLMIQGLEDKSREFGSLWRNIENFNKENLTGSRAYLVDFYKKNDNELNEFVAQFEVEDKQVGAFILINGELVGIELVPNYKMWYQMWRTLIRDCYGSDCISLMKKGLAKNEAFALDITEGTLREQVEKLLKSIKDEINATIESEITEDFEPKIAQNLEDYSLQNLKSSNYLGDVVFHGSHVIYLSLLNKTGKVVKERVQKTISQARWEGTQEDPYRNAKPFSLN